MAKPRLIVITLLALATLSACGSPASNGPANSNTTEAVKSGGGKVEATPTAAPANSNTACYNVKTGEKAVLRSQTFAIDFEPFKSSCFVTSHDPEFKDPPLESEYAIYKDGNKVFDFPDQFNGVTVGCWVEAVAFQDVNADNLTDILVVGKCGAKSGAYNENMAYLNTGKAFITRDDANMKLGNLTTIKDLVGYIKEYPEAFSAK